MRRAVLLLVLALLAPAPAHAEPAGLDVTGWILPSGTNRMVERNADGLSTLSVVGVSVTVRRRGLGSVLAAVPAVRRSTSPATRPPRVKAVWRRPTPEERGMSIGIGWVRCGAVTSIRMPRSTALSWATPTWPLAR